MQARWLRFLIAILIGAGLGLLFGWVISPVKDVNTNPDLLKVDYQADYVLTVAEVYQSEGSLAMANQRLAMLGSAPAAQLSNGSLKEYVNQDNLSPITGVFDFQEVARVGRLLGASLVLCAWVREARVHPPQSLVLYFALVETASSQPIGEMEAAYNASEQEVVLAAQNHLQSRLARRFDNASLNLLLRSPEEYQTFVVAECMSLLADSFK